LLRRHLDRAILFDALAVLRQLVTGDPMLLLECSSLPLLVHAAASQAYVASSSGGGSTGVSAGTLQEGVHTLLRWVHGQLATPQYAARPAAAAARAMWKVWEQHPPAGLATAVSGGAAFFSGTSAAWDRIAAAASLIGTSGPRPLPPTSGYARYAGYAGGGLGGEAGTAAGARRLVEELIHASGLMGELRGGLPASAAALVWTCMGDAFHFGRTC
jgi:hypothetical protein